MTTPFIRVAHEAPGGSPGVMIPAATHKPPRLFRRPRGAPGGSPGVIILATPIQKPPRRFRRPHEAPGGSPGVIILATPASTPPRMPPSAPRGFTLVELLVVIGIIALLAAIITPVVMQSLAKARNAAIKAEIDMLHMAMMNYKNEYGSFPPCADLTGYAPNGPASKHLGRLFPRCTNPSGQFSGFSGLTPANALKAWLSGFTPDPTNPIVPITNRQKLFDFDTSRLDTNQLIYFPSQKPGSPYIYINKTEYPNSWPATPYSYTVNGKSYSIPANTYSARMVSGTYANPDTFQILCAGRDEQFGTDDDLSNFWPGTLREYQDSLKD